MFIACKTFSIRPSWYNAQPCFFGKEHAEKVNSNYPRDYELNLGRRGSRALRFYHGLVDAVASHARKGLLTVYPLLPSPLATLRTRHRLTRSEAGHYHFHPVSTGLFSYKGDRLNDVTFCEP